MPKSIAKLAAKSLLLLLGGAAGACSITPVYGAQIPDCIDETPCQTLGSGWYCDHAQGRCEWDDRGDAGTSSPDDAGR
ncbi:MAG TPA: hypothetical protein VGK67_17705 [Myxococcales bacterium]|jgi:hypothetical protein